MKSIRSTHSTHWLAFCLLLGLSTSQVSANGLKYNFGGWEIDSKVGQLMNPYTKEYHTTLDIQLTHWSDWNFGDIYFFVDHYNDDESKDAFNDNDIYGEFYLNFSSKKLLGINYGNGPIKDIGVNWGFNAGKDSHIFQQLPGINVDWNVPGFLAFRTTFVANLDDSGAPSSQTDGFLAWWSWLYPFEIANQRFVAVGYVEYGKNGRNIVFGNDLKDHFQGMPQIKWDAGYAFTGQKDKLWLGAEYTFWVNKFGSTTEESRPRVFVGLQF